jgi:NitT/TauT family transport system substrate-binding protein
MPLALNAPKSLALAFALIISAVLALGALGTAAARAQGSDPRPVVVYAAQTATTAQLPLMAAIKAGWPGQGRQVEVLWWKSLDDLRSLVLAGKGDIWVGHVETLARAAARGAPVALAEITAWRKFYLISVPLELTPGAAPRHPASVEELLTYANRAGSRVGSSPPNSPMASFLRLLGGPDLIIDSLPPQQLILELSSGRRQIGMLPEPMATAATVKDPNIAIAGSLEIEYARRLGGPDWQPQAAVAVNLSFAKESPELVADLIEMMGPIAAALASGPKDAAAEALPDETIEALGMDTVIKSLSLEPIMARPAAEVAGDIEDFLRVAAPDLYENGGGPPETLILRAGARQGG